MVLRVPIYAICLLQYSVCGAAKIGFYKDGQLYLTLMEGVLLFDQRAG